ncbi:hypothetical protein B9T13_01990 [Wohlfahrtiimonas chitiniclastica]|nr:hypothetical protein B9T13_01990 [Wohlfahrtiimonas chitiniclastica]
MTYVCTEVVNEICRSWIQNTNILNGLPSGMGSEIGWQLFLITLVAWGFKTLARFIINKR